MLTEWLTIFLLAVLELWIAIPTGLFLQVNDHMILLLTMIGGITGVGIVIFAGNRIRSYILKAEKHSEKKKSWSKKVWEKYGIIGLGLASPLLTGSTIGAALAIAFGGKPLQVLFWFSAGVIIWSFIFMFLTKAGLVSLSI